MSAPRPLIVVGPARSGTTLVARMLDAHPQISVAADPLLPLLRACRDAAVAALAPSSLAAGAPFQDCYFQPGPRAALEAFLEASPALPVAERESRPLREALVARAGHEEPELAPTLADLAGSTYGELVADAFDAVAGCSPGASVVGVKEVWAADAIPFLARALPGLRAVVVRRDPRAVVASNLAIAAEDPSQVAHPPSVARHWRKQEALIARFAADPGLRDAIHVVAYEAVLDDNERVSLELASFLGVEADPDLGAADRLRDRAGRRWAANSSYGAAQAGVRPELAHSWRTRLADQDLAVVELIAGEEMAASGYEPSMSRGQAVGELSRRGLASAGAEAWSWRSDLGDADEEHALELRRRGLVGDAYPSASEMRHHFLFPEAHRALRGVGRVAA